MLVGLVLADACDEALAIMTGEGSAAGLWPTDGPLAGCCCSCCSSSSGSGLDEDEPTGSGAPEALLLLLPLVEVESSGEDRGVGPEPEFAAWKGSLSCWGS